MVALHLQAVQAHLLLVAIMEQAAMINVQQMVRAAQQRVRNLMLQLTAQLDITQIALTARQAAVITHQAVQAMLKHQERPMEIQDQLLLTREQARVQGLTMAIQEHHVDLTIPVIQAVETVNSSMTY